MTRLKLGRRVSALFLSVLLLSASVFPAFATSASGQLPEVGWAETVSSFLMASGIYPFESDPETGYEEWSVSSLKALWGEFRDDVTQVSYDIVDLTGNLAKGVIAIASGRWSVLREFATWIVNKYDVTDNQTGVELGKFEFDSLSIPMIQSNSRPNRAFVLTNGVKILTETVMAYYPVSSSNSGVYCVKYPSYFLYLSLDSATMAIETSSSGVSALISTSFSYDGVSYPFFALGSSSLSSAQYSELNSEIREFSDYNSAVMSFLGLSGVGSSFSGITADTTTVSIPAALPEDTDFGGLAVSGTGVAVTPEQLEEIVQNAVKEALKPSVAVVPVALSPDVNVNPSGEITLSGDVTIDTGNIPLQPADYSAPNLTQVFPFSIPWDMLALLNALDAEPVRPEFNVDLYIPVLDVHVPWTIGVSEALQEPVDAFMASVRAMLLIAMCVATLWVFWRSNL